MNKWLVDGYPKDMGLLYKHMSDDDLISLTNMHRCANARVHLNIQVDKKAARLAAVPSTLIISAADEDGGRDWTLEGDHADVEEEEEVDADTVVANNMR